ncbi:MAG: cupredoxin family copper-binding protein [Bacteroidia bacterium]|nr:cupredoxin family copper-binding protein [Bacteroidia bacterium]
MKMLISSKTRLLIGSAFLFALLTISNSCTKSSNDMTPMANDPGSKGTSGTPGTNEVFIQGMAYDPATITVAANTTITWTNKDAVVHTVTSSTGLFDSGSIGTNGTYSHTFTTAGTYPYYCVVHPSMTATVVVN